MYFGNSPIQSTYLTDYLSGDNSTVAFTLARAPISAQSVLVHISGVKQHASTYGVAGTTLTFSEAPPTGTNNIEVLHLGISPETVTLPSYRTVTEFTATAGQTTFSPASYTVGYIDVFRNGVKLGTADFTATNGTSVVLNNGCSVGDLVRCEGFLITAFNDAIPNTAGAVGDSLIASVSASKLTGSRTLPNTVVPAGSIIQVVSAALNTYVSSSSNTFVDTGVTATITPISATSKILILINHAGCSKESNNTSIMLKLLRGSTQIAYLEDRAGATGNTSTNFIGPMSTNYLDSPSTTSATTYKTQFASAANNGLVSIGNYGATPVVSTITLLEIAA